MKSLTVYCSSSRHVADIYFDVAQQLGHAVASEGWTLVYGGNAVGPMGRMADAARAAGGKVIGVTPQLLVDQGMADRQCHELLVTSSMRQRKELMEQRADAFLALPGGLGTLEELFEILVAKYLDCHNKPVILLNVEQFYNPLQAMIEHGVEHGFIKPRVRQLYFTASSVAQAMEHLRSHRSDGAI